MLVICLLLYVFQFFLSLLFKGSLSQGSLICLWYAYFFSTSEPEYAYKRYAYKKKKHVPHYSYKFPRVPWKYVCQQVVFYICQSTIDLYIHPLLHTLGRIVYKDETSKLTRMLSICIFVYFKLSTIVFVDELILHSFTTESYYVIWL